MRIWDTQARVSWGLGLLGGSWVLIAKVVSPLTTYLGDLGGLISTVIIGVISTLNLQVNPKP